MKLPRLAIDNYQFTIIIFLLLTFAGVSSYLNMPRTENPAVYIPGASIVVIYPGASPSDMEQLISIPIEEAINELDDIIEIKSTIMDGVAVTSVEFSYDTDPDDKYDEVLEKFNSIRGDLPKEIYDVSIVQYSSSDVAMLQYALVGDSLEYSLLKQQADKLKKELDRAYGVRKVEVLACPEQEVRISVDLMKMARMNISLDQLFNAIKSNNANIPGGSINIANKNFSIKTSGSYRSIDEIRNTVVSSYNGQMVFLKNIASVNFDYEDQIYEARYNGRKAVFIIVKQKDNRNIFKIMDDIRPRVEKYKQGLDSGTELHTVFDQSVIVEDRISGFIGNLLQGIVLVGLVILLALGVKSSIIVIIAIPLSILTGLFFVDSYGFGLEQITIAALVVALGLLVDNSIVIIENINRFLLEGLSPREASIKGTAQIGWPIVSSTITTLLAFVPIIMMPDKAGDFIRGLPVTIVATLGMSLVIALTLSPLLSRMVLRKPKLKNGNKKGFQGLLQKFIDGPYKKTLAFSLKNRLLIIVFAVLMLVASGLVFITSVGYSFFPSSETPQFLIRVNLPDGENLESTAEAVLFVEKILDTIPEVTHYASNIGHGNPRVYYNVFSKNYAKNYADIYVQLDHFEHHHFFGLVKDLRTTFKEYAGAKINLQVFEQGVPTEAPVMIYVEGENVDTLKSIASYFERILEDQPGIINLENQLSKKKTDLFININKQKANFLGVPIYEIDKTVRIAVAGYTIDKFRDNNGKEYEIVVRMPEMDENSMEYFDNIYVKSLSGKQIPLMQLVDIEYKAAPSLIKRRNLSRTALITADMERGYNLDEVLAPVIEELKAYNFPNGFTYHISGEIEARGETFGGMGIALIIAVVGIFAVLVLQFKSFIQPVIIFVSFILALIGVVWALFLTGYSFSFTAFVGFISLAGIVVNNAIILIDYANQLRKEGVPLLEAIATAGQVRFTPIILTTLTTIGGLLPLTLKGGEMWAPLGWTIIGGLLVSTFLTLIVIPVLYHMIESLTERLTQKRLAENK
ncbi:MAG: AcrB/AcrD/AcrF family protein [Marinilabiliales bacterium]|nr:MAG: AcrB/AcrD/AcrF family protein [Marinilabiliales bacterium]